MNKGNAIVGRLRRDSRCSGGNEGWASNEREKEIAKAAMSRE